MKLPLKKSQSAKLSAPQSRAVALFRDIIPIQNLEHEVCKMRGNAFARILVVAPPCDAYEINKGMPFVNQSAQEAHTILSDYGISTDKHFLIVSCSRYGLKPSKHSTDMIRNYVMKCAEERLFDYYVCIGDTAFKFVFGAGKKPSSSTLVGSTLYVPETGRKPLFVFPNTDLLAPQLTDDEWLNRKLSRIQDQFNVKFHKVCKRFKDSLTQHHVSI